jgi:6-phosphogluconolactonase
MRFLIIWVFIFSTSLAMAQDNFLLVGTYTGTGSKGIYVYSFNNETGKASLINHTESVDNPSYLAVSKDGNFVYAVNETQGDKQPLVSAFSFNKKTGRLTFINQQPSGGDNPCYVAISPAGDYLTVGNYSGGSVGLFAIAGDGSLKQRQVIQHTGKSVNEKRQEKAHVHSTVFSPEGNYLFTPDLGMDKVMGYKFNPGNAEILTPADQAFTETVPGSGPRHLEFHPSLPLAYLIEEMAGYISVYKYAEGKLEFISRHATHSKSYTGNIGSADVHVSPDGKYLYASNRGDQNTITIFRIGEKGIPEYIAEQSTLGKTPRNFMIDPSGSFLLVANQNSDEIVIFKRHVETGMLTDTGQRIKVPKPVCLKLVGK